MRYKKKKPHLTPAQKDAIRRQVYERDGGKCQLNLGPKCYRGILPEDLRELARQIVTKVARETAAILHTRNSLGLADDCFEGISESGFCDDAENLATGEECGCLEPEEAIEGSLMVWVERAITERIAKAESSNRELREQVEPLKRKLAVLFDQSCYSDSLGVEGSSFSVCRWCGGGSGPGGSSPFKHGLGCLFDDGELENRVADVWQESDGELAELKQQITALEAQVDRLSAPVSDEEWNKLD